MDRRYLMLLLLVVVGAFAATWWLTGNKSDPKATEWAGKQAPAANIPAQFESCEDARKAGRAPLLAGQPGYNKKLDPDGTGVACPP